MGTASFSDKGRSVIAGLAKNDQTPAFLEARKKR